MNRYHDKAEAHYIADEKTLVIEQKKSEFVPSYVFYVVEYFAKKLDVEIEYVQFLYDNGNKYEVKKMQKIYDWSDLK